MSLLYCTIALILGCTYADAGLGSVQGTTGLSPAGKAFACLNALGSLGFACEPQLRLPCLRAASGGSVTHGPCVRLLPHLFPVHPPPATDGVSNVLMEVTDTLRQPPSAVQQMRRSINVALTVAAAFYISVACTVRPAGACCEDKGCCWLRPPCHTVSSPHCTPIPTSGLRQPGRRHALPRP